MPLYTTTRCCYNVDGPLPFATIGHDESSHEIQIQIRGQPCCKAEFQTLLQALRTIRSNIACGEFKLLYVLGQKCVFNASYMRQQESILKGSQGCAIVTSNAVLRTAIKLATISKPNRNRIKTFGSVPTALKWLRAR